MAQRILAKHIRIISDYISAMNIEPIWLQNLEQFFFCKWELRVIEPPAKL